MITKFLFSFSVLNLSLIWPTIVILQTEVPCLKGRSYLTDKEKEKIDRERNDAKQLMTCLKIADNRIKRFKESIRLLSESQPWDEYGHGRPPENIGILLCGYIEVLDIIKNVLTPNSGTKFPPKILENLDRNLENHIETLNRFQTLKATLPKDKKTQEAIDAAKNLRHQIIKK
jgi:hypothetical protein